MVDDQRRVLLREQRFHFAAEIGVLPARLGQKRRARRRLALQREVVKVGDLTPPVRIHGISGPESLR